MKHFVAAGFIKRVETYAGVVALIVVVAVLAELMKAGHMLGLAEIFTNLAHWIAHYLSDVASAEVGATILIRAFEN